MRSWRSNLANPSRVTSWMLVESKSRYPTRMVIMVLDISSDSRGCFSDAVVVVSAAAAASPEEFESGAPSPLFRFFFFLRRMNLRRDPASAGLNEYFEKSEILCFLRNESYI